MKAYSQILFDEIFRLSAQAGINTYESLPPLSVDYPFVVISDITTQHDVTKTAIYPQFIAEIQAWGEDRLSASDLVDQLMQRLTTIAITENTYHIDYQQSTSWVRAWEELDDKTLWRGQLTLNFKKG